MNNQPVKKTAIKTIEKTKTFSATKVFLTVTTVMAFSLAAYAALFMYIEKDTINPVTKIETKERLVIEGYPHKIMNRNPNSPIAVGNIDPDSIAPEFAFCGKDGQLYVYNISAYHYDPYLLTGFPQPGCSSGDIGSAKPAIGDIDGDGQLEIVVGSYSDSQRALRLYAYNHDGTKMNANWPITPDPYLDSRESITLADTNNDDILEIIVVGESYDNPGTFIFDQNGNRLAELQYGNMTEVSVADLDGDGSVEIVVGETHRKSGGDDYYTNVSLYDGNGNELPGDWPKTLDGTVQTNFAIGDIDTSTSELEIVVACTGLDYNAELTFSDIYVWDYLGNSISSNWPKRITSPEGYGPSVAGVSIGDIVTNEGEETTHLEIIASVVDNLYILDDTGQPINDNWPLDIDAYVVNPPLIGDFDGDEQADLLVTGFVLDGINTIGRLFVLDSNGESVLETPDDYLYLHKVEGVTFGAAAADFENDGKTEVIFSVFNENYQFPTVHGIYRLDLSSSYDAATMQWSQYEHDGRNTGNYQSQCSGGTYSGECSAQKPNYCQDGELIKNCAICGCPTSLGSCQSNGSCQKKTPTPSSEILQP
ncbi:MAG: VCBS repeat-containing protein [Patescibacteria group bacterium]